MSSSPSSSEAYFSSQPPPANLAQVQSDVSRWLEKMKAKGKRVVLVTSGGTSVPLEKNMVRFLDNFSAGTRGATSAEYFLSHSYAVLFLHRQHSLLPFSRHYSHSTHPFLNLLTITPPSPSSPSSSPAVSIDPTELESLLPILTRHHEAQKNETLLTVPFVTVNEYLWLLKGVSEVMGGVEGVGRKGLFYLAAAVSDFFLPEDKMAEHKIQSGNGAGVVDSHVEDGRLTLSMDPVPKILKPLVQEWNREGYIVSFKLETDPTLLLPKARAALDRYGHQLVIGNDLHRRKFEVVFVEPAPTTSPSSEGAGGGYRESWIRFGEEDVNPAGRRDGKGAREIEKEIVEALVERHEKWIGEGVDGGSAV